MSAELIGMIEPLFSIIIVHSQADSEAASLKRSLDALDRQSYQNFEVLVYYEGSAPELLEEAVGLRQYPRISRYEWRDEADDDAVSLRERGMSQARGEYIIHLMPEDLLYDFALERIVSVMRTPRRNLAVDPRSGQILEGFPELAVDMNRNDILIMAIVRVGVECDGTRYWMNRQGDRRSGMMLSGFPALPGLVEPMQFVVRRAIWEQYGGWKSDTAIFARMVQEHRARCVPAVLGEHW